MGTSSMKFLLTAIFFILASYFLQLGQFQKPTTTTTTTTKTTTKTTKTTTTTAPGPTTTGHSQAGKDCNVKNKPGADFIQVETHNVVQLCNSYWGYGQMYRRFNDLISFDNHTGISLFNNAKIDHNGILGAIADFNRGKHNKTLSEYGDTKFIRVYGGTDKTRKELQGLEGQLKWKTVMKYVAYKKHSCGEALVIGKGA